MSAPLARLRPEKFDDAAIQQQIALIKDVCGNIDLDIIAVVFHECDYNMQKTIARLNAGEFEDEGWQTAKSNNKKKNHSNEQISNGILQSDSQRTSPTLSQRSGQQLQYSTRSNPSRREKENIPESSETNLSLKTNEILTTNSISDYDYSNENRKDMGKHLNKIRQAVSMHPIIGFSSEPIDIQFGDIKWEDSLLVAATPSNSPILNQQIDDEHILQMNEINDNLTTNNIDIEFQQPVSQLSPTIINTEDISHLSDQLKDPTQENISDYQSLTSQNNNPSAFTPYTTQTINYQQIPRDYSQTLNPQQQQQSINYKPNPKTPFVQTPNYPQQAPYPIAAQQQYFLGAYPYPAHPIYPMFTSVEPWSTMGYESYPTYPTTNYISAYPNQQAYHSNPKHEVYPYDKDFFANYGQTRLINPEPSSSSSSSQQSKDVLQNSKLSATAASFSQATNPTTIYINPVVYPFPTYIPSPQDRTITYPSIDNRDNRTGASYNGGNPSNRTHYQRTHNNSTWHPQQ